MAYDSALAAAIRASRHQSAGTGTTPDGKPVKRAHEDIPVVSLRDAGRFVRASNEEFAREVGM